MTCPISVAWFDSAYDAQNALGKTRTYTWPEFVAELASKLAATAPGEDRTRLPMFVPAAWRASRRCKASVAALTLGVLDVDGVAPAQLDAVCQALAPFQAAIYSSPRDPLPDGRRKVRVIVALDQAVAPEDCARLRQGLAQALNVENDSATMTDESRGFFVGRLADAPARQLWVSPGQQPVQVAPILARVPPAPPRDLASGYDLPDTGGDADELVGRIPDSVLTYTAETFATLMQTGQKNNLLYALGGTLRQWGWSAEDAAILAHRCLIARSVWFHDVGDVQAGIDTIIRGYFVDARHGWDRVKALIGPVADAFESGLPTRYNRARQIMVDAQQNPWYQSLARQVETTASAKLAATEALAVAMADEWCGFELCQPGDGKPLDSLIEGLEMAPRLAGAILGRAGSAKSPTAIHMALCMANGLPWHGRKTQRCEVLYFAAEKIYDLIDKRDRLARPLGVDPMSVRMLALREPLNDPAVRGRLIELIRKRVALGHKVMVMLDTYAASVDGLEHNKSTYAEPLRKLVEESTTAGACTAVILHARKGESGAKNKAPQLGDAEGATGLAGALSWCIGVWYPDEEDKYRVHYYCVRAARRGFTPFELRWSDITKDDNEEWGIECTPLAIKPEDKDAATREEPESEVTARIVRAAAKYMHELCQLQGIELRDDVVHTRPLSAVAEMIAKGCGVSASKAAAAIEMCRVRDNVGHLPIVGFPFWGSGDQLNLRFVKSTPATTFNNRGAGHTTEPPAEGEPRPPAPSEGYTPYTQPIRTALRSFAEACAVSNGFDGPADQFVQGAKLAWPDDPYQRRNMLGVIRDVIIASGVTGEVEASKGQSRPAWVNIRSNYQQGE